MMLLMELELFRGFVWGKGGRVEGLSVIGSAVGHVGMLTYCCKGFLVSF